MSVAQDSTATLGHKKSILDEPFLQEPFLCNIPFGLESEQLLWNRALFYTTYKNWTFRHLNPPRRLFQDSCWTQKFQRRGKKNTTWPRTVGVCTVAHVQNNKCYVLSFPLFGFLLGKTKSTALKREHSKSCFYLTYIAHDLTFDSDILFIILLSVCAR